METKLEEYALKTIEDIGEYFLQLHSHIQNEQKKIVETFAEICVQPQFALRQAYVKLNESNELLTVSITPCISRWPYNFLRNDSVV